VDSTQIQLINWILSGSSEIPHVYKQLVLLEYANKYNLRILIETGTYQGDMIEAMQNYFDFIVSIELSPHLYLNAGNKFINSPHVSLLLGDSGKLLPEVLKHITIASLFWLDGHYSEGITAKGDLNTPIINELTAILNHGINNHVILIDDARLFNGKEDYPTIEELNNTISKYGYNLLVKNDIVRITPISISPFITF